MSEFKPGDWVSTPFGVGQVRTTSKLKVEVQLGASGPFYKLWKSRISWATPEQIRQVTGQ